MDPKRVYAEWGPKAEEALLSVLRAGVFVKGPHVAAFEQAFAALVGVRHAVAVDSGTEALTLVLKAVLAERAPERREVILPAFTFVATAGAVVNAGGRPVFADVDADTMNLSPASVAARLSTRTAAVIPVHIFGAIADLGGIRGALAGRDDVFVLEDAAQSIHALAGGRRAGALAQAGAFSFYPSKNLGGVGDGGAVTTDDPVLADAVASLRDHGQRKKMYSHERVGVNARMDELQAAALCAKLPRVEAWTAARRRLARRYDEAFAGSTVVPQRVLQGTESAYHLYTVRVPERDRVKAALEAAGVATGIYYPVPLQRQACFAPYAPDACPVSDRLALEVLSLPLFPGLRDEEQARVIQTVLSVVGGLTVGRA
jgi:dTDP-4-amino-4,6-dideoxygalactose transaminase